MRYLAMIDDEKLTKVDKSSRGVIHWRLVFVAVWMGIPFPCSREIENIT